MNLHNLGLINMLNGQSTEKRAVVKTNQDVSQSMRKSQLAISSFNFKQFLCRIIVITLIIIFFVLPIIRLVMMSFSGDEGFTLAYYQEMLSQKRTWSVLQNTLIMLIGSVTISSILGVVFAWLVAYTDIRMKRFIQLMVFLPFVIPSYITSLAWVQFFGSGGMLNQFLRLFIDRPPTWNLYSMSGIIAVMAISTYPLVFMFTVNTFRQIPRENELAARVSGASGWQTFRKVTMPMARPGIVGGVFIAFLSSLDNFGVPSFLGTPANISVLT